jgi:hypothetical protein
MKFSTHFKAARANRFFLLGRSREGDSRGIPTNPRAAAAGPYPTAAAATGGGGGGHARASKAAGRDGAVRRVPSRGGSTTWRRRWRLGSGAAALAMCGACWRAAGRHGRDGGGREGGGLRRRSLARRCPWQQRISSVALLLSGGLFPGLTWARSWSEKLARLFRLPEARRRCRGCWPG